MNPILFHIGPIPVFTYGFCVAVGVLLALFLMKKRGVQEGLNPDETMDLVLLFTMASFLGARLFYVILNWDYFQTAPLDIFKIWEGGIAFYGGAAGSLVFLFFYSRRRKWAFLKATDFLAPFVFLTHGFGRIGCFFNGCCYGKESYLPWAVRYPFLPYSVHPVQLYSAILDFICFYFLLGIHARKRITGETTLAYFAVYGTIRFLLEFFRGDSQPFLIGLTLFQWISVLFVLVSALSYFFFLRRLQTDGQSKNTSSGV